ncbi:MAG: glycosyltransferase family 39 protein [Anaerolineales bacterium]
MKRRAPLLAYLVPLLTLLVRALWLARFGDDPLEPVDARGYHLLARNLLAGRGLAMTWDPPYCSTSLRAPLYPLFLAGTYGVFGLEPARAVLAHLLLEAVTGALVVRLAREVGGGRVALPAGLLYALNGTTQRYVGVLYSELLLLSLVAAALWASVLALRRAAPRPALVAGALWGLAVLTKPNVQYLAVAVGLLLLARILLRRSQVERSLLPGATFFLALALVLAPWLLRNRLLFDRWMISTAFEENLARVSAPATLAEVRGVRVIPWTETWEALYGELTVEAVLRFGASVEDESTLSCFERERWHREVASVARELVNEQRRAFLAAHLKGVLRSLLRVGHRTWYLDLTGEPWEATGILDDVWQRMLESFAVGAVGDAFHALWLERVIRAPPGPALLWWGLLLARVLLWWLALRGLLRLLRRRPYVALLLLGTLAYFILLPGPIAYERFYMPAIPTTVTLVACGEIRMNNLCAGRDRGV